MKKVLIFLGDDFEDMEVMYPKYRLEERDLTWSWRG